jgi:hypothetical protein
MNDLDALEDSVDWARQPGIDDDIARAEVEAALVKLLGEDEVRLRYGVPKRV